MPSFKKMASLPLCLCRLIVSKTLNGSDPLYHRRMGVVEHGIEWVRVEVGKVIPGKLDKSACHTPGIISKLKRKRVSLLLLPSGKITAYRLKRESRNCSNKPKYHYLSEKRALIDTKKPCKQVILQQHKSNVQHKQCYCFRHHNTFKNMLFLPVSCLMGKDCQDFPMSQLLKQRVVQHNTLDLANACEIGIGVGASFRCVNFKNLADMDTSLVHQSLY